MYYIRPLRSLLSSFSLSSPFSPTYIHASYFFWSRITAAVEFLVKDLSLPSRRPLPLTSSIAPNILVLNLPVLKNPNMSGFITFCILKCSICFFLNSVLCHGNKMAMMACTRMRNCPFLCMLDILYTLSIIMICRILLSILSFNHICLSSLVMFLYI
jgi:hypothetical protein